MAIIQKAFASGVNPTATFASLVTPGNAILVFAGIVDSTHFINDVTDDQSQFYTFPNNYAEYNPSSNPSLDIQCATAYVQDSATGVQNIFVDFRGGFGDVLAYEVTQPVSPYFSPLLGDALDINPCMFNATQTPTSTPNQTSGGCSNGLFPTWQYNFNEMAFIACTVTASGEFVSVAAGWTMDIQNQTAVAYRNASKSGGNVTNCVFTLTTPDNFAMSENTFYAPPLVSVINPCVVSGGVCEGGSLPPGLAIQTTMFDTNVFRLSDHSGMQVFNAGPYLLAVCGPDGNYSNRSGVTQIGTVDIKKNGSLLTTMSPDSLDVVRYLQTLQLGAGDYIQIFPNTGIMWQAGSVGLVEGGTQGALVASAAGSSIPNFGTGYVQLSTSGNAYLQNTVNNAFGVQLMATGWYYVTLDMTFHSVSSNFAFYWEYGFDNPSPGGNAFMQHLDVPATVGSMQVFGLMRSPQQGQKTCVYVRMWSNDFSSGTNIPGGTFSCTLNVYPLSCHLFCGGMSSPILGNPLL